MVPAHGHAAAERTMARAGGARAVCQLRHMETVEKAQENDAFSVCSVGAPVWHNHTLCSKGQHVPTCGMRVSPSNSKGQLIPHRVIYGNLRRLDSHSQNLVGSPPLLLLGVRVARRPRLRGRTAHGRVALCVRVAY
jgi:hypothetical protein